ncbi:MAG: hypothetical protein ACRDD2_01775 [Sarcina sp.]
MIKIHSGENFPLNNFYTKEKEYINIESNAIYLKRGLYNLFLKVIPSVLNDGDRFSIYLNDSFFKTYKIPLLSTKELNFNLSLQLEKNINSFSIKNSSDDFINLDIFQGGIIMASPNLIFEILSTRKVIVTLADPTLTFTSTTTLTTAPELNAVPDSPYSNGGNSRTFTFGIDLLLSEVYEFTFSNLTNGIDNTISTSEDLIPASLSSVIDSVSYTDIAFDISLKDGFSFNGLNNSSAIITRLDSTPNLIFNNIKIKFFTTDKMTLLLEDNRYGKFVPGNYELAIDLLGARAADSIIKISGPVEEHSYKKLLVSDCTVVATGNRIIEIEFKGSVNNLDALSTTLNPGFTVLNNFYISYFSRDPQNKNNPGTYLGYISITQFDFKVNDLNNRLLIQSRINLPVPYSDSDTSHHDMIINSIKLGTSSAILTDVLNRPLDLTVLPFNTTESPIETFVQSVTVVNNTILDVVFTQPVCAFNSQKNAFANKTVNSIFRYDDELNHIIYTLSSSTPVTPLNNSLTFLGNVVTDAFGLPVNQWGPQTVTVPSIHPTLVSAVQDKTTTDFTRVILTFSASMDVPSTADLKKYLLTFDQDNDDLTNPISIPDDYIADAIITQSLDNDAVFFIDFKDPLPSGNYFITPLAVPVITEPIMDMFQNTLVDSTTLPFVVINFISPKILDVYVPEPTAYGVNSDSMVIVFDQPMLSKLSTVTNSIPSESIYAIDNIDNYALTPKDGNRLCLDNSYGSAIAMYRDEWVKLELNSMDSIGKFTTCNPLINIGYTLGPNIKFVRSYYANTTFKGNIYPLCSPKNPTIFVNPLSINKDIISVTDSNSLILNHIVADSSDVGNHKFFNFFTTLAASDFTITATSTATVVDLTTLTTISMPSYETIDNLLGQSVQQILFNMPSNVLGKLDGDSVIKIAIATTVPASTDMFNKPVVPSSVSVNINSIVSATIVNATLSSNSDNGKEYYKSIGITMTFSNNLNETQTLIPSQFIVSSDNSASAYFITTSATIPSTAPNTVVINALIPRFDPCTKLYISLDNSSLLDATGHLISDFSTLPLISNTI